jgi:hypothetical protein
MKRKSTERKREAGEKTRNSGSARLADIFTPSLMKAQKGEQK